MSILVIGSSSRTLKKLDDLISPGDEVIDLVVTREQDCPDLEISFRKIFRLTTDSFSVEGNSVEDEENIKNKNYKNIYILCNDIYSPIYRNVEKFARNFWDSPTVFLDDKGNEEEWHEDDISGLIDQYSTEPDKSFVKNHDFDTYEYADQFKEMKSFLLNKLREKEIKSSILDDDRYPGDIEELLVVRRKEYINKMGRLPLARKKIKIFERTLVKKHECGNIYRLKFPARLENTTVNCLVGEPAEATKNDCAVIAVHGYSSSPSKVMGIGRKDYTYQFGLKLLKRGFFVVAPFIINHGNYAPNLEALSSLNNHALSIFNVDKIVSCIDILQEKYNFRDENIGYYGISAGGQTGLRVGVYDQRIQCMVISGHLADLFNWGIRYASRDSRIRMRAFTWPEIINKLHFQPAELAMLNFPSKILFENGRRDRKHKLVQSAFEKVKKLYSEFGLSQNIHLHEHPGYHETAVDELPFEFFVKNLC